MIIMGVKIIIINIMLIGACYVGVYAVSWTPATRTSAFSCALIRPAASAASARSFDRLRPGLE